MEEYLDKETIAKIIRAAMEVHNSVGCGFHRTPCACTVAGYGVGARLADSEAGNKQYLGKTKNRSYE